MKFLPLPCLSQNRILVLVITMILTLPLQAQELFSRKEVLEDLDYLYESLQAAHYNAFAYTPKAEFDSVYTSIKNTIQKDSMNLLEITNAFQPLTSAINNGHTAIEFPIPLYVKYAYAGGKVFPLELAFENGRALVRKNWSGNESITTDSELISINGVPVDTLLSKIYPHISAERPYFKKAKLELLTFPRYYWQVFGEQAEFAVEIRANGSEKIYNLKAIKALDDYEMKRVDIITGSRELNYFGETAYLKPGNFSGDEAAYRKFIDSSFVAVKEKKSRNLVLDFRNNAGGDDSFSDYLVSYIADKPFKWYGDFSLKTSKFLKEHVRKERDTTNAFWRSALKHENGEIYDYDFEAHMPQPREKRFEGKVYVLINRQTHSQSAVAAAQIQDYGFATLAGEETGDYPSLYASIYSYTLPNTGIPVNVSKGRIIRVNGSTKEEGVVPDIPVRDHLLDEEDEILMHLLQEIR